LFVLPAVQVENDGETYLQSKIQISPHVIFMRKRLWIMCIRCCFSMLCYMIPFFLNCTKD